MNVREEVYEQIIEILKNARFPINKEEELIAALPDGLDTTCMVGAVVVTASEARSLITERFPIQRCKKCGRING